MRNLERELRYRKIDNKKLSTYGFKNHIYQTKICNDEFEVIVEVQNDTMISKVIDIENEEEYILVDMEESTGEFVGKVRKAYEEILSDIIANCTNKEVFKAKQSKEIIEYVKEKYQDELEFLWEKFDNNAIWRNKQNKKWYGALLTVQANKLGDKSNQPIEIIDLRYQKEEIETIIDNKKVFPGYHMNKKSWITIKLDDSVATKKILGLVDNSYQLSIGNKCGYTGNSLSQKVYDYLTTIPKGKVVTYKQVAEHLGNKGLARAVGNILHKNPDEKKYPCYKVLNSKGELAEAFVFGGKNIQKKRLEQDGIKVVKDKVDLGIYQWKENQIDS